MLKHPALGIDAAGSRQRRNEVEDLFAAAFAQAQAFEQRIDVVRRQRLVVEYMVDVGRVVHQGAELTIDPLIDRGGQSQPRTGQVGGMDPHPAQVQVLQAVFPQGPGKAFVRRLRRAVADQAGDLDGPAGQQCFHQVHADKTVGAGHNHLVDVAGAVGGQHVQIQFPRDIDQDLFAQRLGGGIATDQHRQPAQGRLLDKTVDGDAPAILLANAQQHFRQQDRVTAQVEETLVGGDILDR